MQSCEYIFNVFKAVPSQSFFFWNEFILVSIKSIRAERQKIPILLPVRNIHLEAHIEQFTLIVNLLTHIVVAWFISTTPVAPEQVQPDKIWE